MAAIVSQTEVSGTPDEVFAYVTDPRPSRNRHLEGLRLPMAEPLYERSWRPWPPPHRLLHWQLDAMVLDGVEDREEVAALLAVYLPVPFTLEVT